MDEIEFMNLADQEGDEWVILLLGSAGLLFDGEPEPRVLRPGDALNIPAHRRHRSRAVHEQRIQRHLGGEHRQVDHHLHLWARHRGVDPDVRARDQRSRQRASGENGGRTMALRLPG